MVPQPCRPPVRRTWRKRCLALGLALLAALLLAAVDCVDSGSERKEALPPRRPAPTASPRGTLPPRALTPRLTPSVETAGRIIDGDTLVLASGEWIRLLGIDAPERRAAGGAEATEALRRLVAGKRLRVVREGFDRYGRTLARLFVLPEERDVSAELLREGQGVPWPKPPEAGRAILDFGLARERLPTGS